jgi:DNA polymerase/3'-5' exonuclease PolX
LDLVAILKGGDERQRRLLRNEIGAALGKTCLQGEDGPQNMGFTMPDGWPIGLYLARGQEEYVARDLFGVAVKTPESPNFGSLFVCRTGSKEFNVWLCQTAARKGLKWSPYRGVVDKEGRLVRVCHEEMDVFAALGIKEFVAPKARW